ncbi:MAG: hypothetical protein ACLQVD_11685, partial [Capsulimonadaceae bacterium]
MGMMSGSVDTERKRFEEETIAVRPRGNLIPESAPERSDGGGNYALRKESAPERSDGGGHYALRKESAPERSDGGGHNALRKESEDRHSSVSVSDDLPAQ